MWGGVCTWGAKPKMKKWNNKNKIKNEKKNEKKNSFEKKHKSEGCSTPFRRHAVFTKH